MTEHEKEDMDKLEALNVPFKPEQIKNRPQAGRKLDYIDTPLVIKRLNDVFGLWWSFECENVTPDGEAIDIAVYGTLSVNLTNGKLPHGVIKKSQYGAKRRIVKRDTGEVVSEYGDDLKAAASDCLKKCATLFGVALHLYEAKSDKVNNARQENSAPAETVIVVNGARTSYKKEQPAGKQSSDKVTQNQKDLFAKLLQSSHLDEQEKRRGKKYYESETSKRGMMDAIGKLKRQIKIRREETNVVA